MNANLGSLLVGTLIFSTSESLAVDGKLCEVYQNVYDRANKEISSAVAKGIGDNSAPRATLREMRVLNERMLQMITLEQMHFHGCNLPKKTSSKIEYITPAINCETARLKGKSGALECESSKWESVFEGIEHFK